MASLPLVLHQHDQARNDVQRGHQHDQGEDQEHHVAFDLKCGEKGRGTPAPIDQEHRPPGGVCHRPSEFIDPVGAGFDEDFDRGSRRGAIEIGLRLGEWQKDHHGIIFRHVEANTAATL